MHYIAGFIVTISCFFFPEELYLRTPAKVLPVLGVRQQSPLGLPAFPSLLFSRTTAAVEMVR